ncbi:Hypothetical predicted protein [Olea europaea subsp. europaea]|uniref:Uncharacterized protein n=1 Tax=Olea europaea subsp. europaea TaxID=158383 RepID=A0A8S0TV88_OLEEU|nr:Hypothetical predicted protein [Olea europaea subsp. europaea]
MIDIEQTEPFRQVSDSISDSENEVLDENATVESPSTMEFNSHVSAIGVTAPTNYNDGDEVSGKTTTAFTSHLEDLIDRALELGSATVYAKNYGLQSSQGESGEEQTKEQIKREKPYISKAERRKIKKGKKDNTEGASIYHEKEVEENCAEKDNPEVETVDLEKQEVEENHDTTSYPDKNV